MSKHLCIIHQTCGDKPCPICAIPTGPVTPAEVRDLLKIALKSPEELHPDFGSTDSALSSETTPRASTALVPGSRVGASEARGVQPKSEIDIAVDGMGTVWGAVARSFFKTK